MDSHTLRSRLVLLIQKSRKAVRLYSSVEKTGFEVSGVSKEGGHKDLQSIQWKEVTGSLLRELTGILENPNTRRLATDAYTLRDRFYSDWRLAESDLHTGQRDLIRSAEQSDYMTAAALAGKLISLKARVQACQAAYHELNDVLAKSRVADPAISLTERSHDEVESVFSNIPSKSVTSLGLVASSGGGKVIPITKKRAISG